MVTNCFGTPCNNELVEFTRVQLSKSGDPTPAVTISSTLPGCSINVAPSTCADGSLYGPYGVAVDPFGDVWVSIYNTPTTVEFGWYQLFKSGSPTPRRTIAGSNTGMNWPSFVVLAPWVLLDVQPSAAASRGHSQTYWSGSVVRLVPLFGCAG